MLILLLLEIRLSLPSRCSQVFRPGEEEEAAAAGGPSSLTFLQDRRTCETPLRFPTIPAAIRRKKTARSAKPRAAEPRRRSATRETGCQRRAKRLFRAERRAAGWPGRRSAAAALVTVLRYSGFSQETSQTEPRRALRAFRGTSSLTSLPCRRLRRTCAVAGRGSGGDTCTCEPLDYSGSSWLRFASLPCIGGSARKLFLGSLEACKRTRKTLKLHARSMNIYSHGRFWIGSKGDALKNRRKTGNRDGLFVCEFSLWI